MGPDSVIILPSIFFLSIKTKHLPLSTNHPNLTILLSSLWNQRYDECFWMNSNEKDLMGFWHQHAQKEWLQQYWSIRRTYGNHQDCKAKKISTLFFFFFLRDWDAATPTFDFPIGSTMGMTPSLQKLHGTILDLELPRMDGPIWYSKSLLVAVSVWYRK